jgi:hypothetical protein
MAVNLPHDTRDEPVEGRVEPDLVRKLRNRFLAAEFLRRGVCLLNAGRFAEAEGAFRDTPAARGRRADRTDARKRRGCVTL